MYEEREMPTLEKVVLSLRSNQKNVSFSDALRVCEHYFGEYRIQGSHFIFKTPWKGEPRINIQNKNGQVKPYQVRQIITAIDKLTGERNGRS